MTLFYPHYKICRNQRFLETCITAVTATDSNPNAVTQIPGHVLLRQKSKRRECNAATPYKVVPYINYVH